MENVKEVLKLSVEHKGALMSVGELTVYLDGLTVGHQEELATLTNGDATNGNNDILEKYPHHYCTFIATDFSLV